MPWYAAHAIIYFEYTDGGQQGEFQVYENVYLIEAETVQEGFAKARELAKRNDGDSSGSLRQGDRPVRSVFGGIRKLITVLGEHEVGERPGNGHEVTYSELIVADRESLNLLINDEDVTVEYIGKRSLPPV